MMKKYFLGYLFFYLFFLPLSFGQKSISNVWQIQQLRQFHNTDAQLRPENFYLKKAVDFSLAKDSKMELSKTEFGFNGFEHLKYQQYHQGIPVFGATYVLHSKDGIVQNSNGYFRPNIETATTPNLSAEQALEIAIHEMAATSYIWEKEAPSKLSSMHKKPIPQLILIDPAYPKVSEETVLAYKIDLYSWVPLDKQQYFINAHNGQVITQLPLLAAHAVPATGDTRYYGTQDLIVDSIGPSEFYLRDLSRGQGIHTFDAQEMLFENNSSHWNLNNPAQDEVALDAHYCTEKNYDLLLQKFQWNGLDNQGGSMNTLVHLNNGAEIVNAYWDGTMALFGDGNCNHSPLTTLEIVGHEFTHGIIQHTSQLIYASESGAINESLADVFGKLLEHTEAPAHFNWDIGRSFKLHADDTPFRSMDDPKSLKNPAFYKGEFWVDGANVHTNSSIGNLWFYILSEGKTGVNENNETYDTEGIGIDKAADVVFLCNRSYLVPDSDYFAYYQTSILAAEELYGLGSTEVLAVKEAWKAVGLPYSNNKNLDLSISIPSPFEKIETCQFSGFTATQCVLTNLGTETYLPGNEDILKANFYDPIEPREIIIPLSSTLAPGESITFSFDTLISIDQKHLDTSYGFRLEIDGDEDEKNNSKYGRYVNYEFDNNALMVTFARVEFYDCLTENHKVTAFLKNQGCDTFPMNQTFQLVLEDSSHTVYWSETLSLDQALSPNRFRSIQRDISFIPEEGKSYFMALVVPNSPFSVENKAALDIWVPQEITIDYTDDFSTALSLEKNAQIYSRLDPPIFPFNNENYLVTSGQTTFLQTKSCFNPEENVEGNLSYPISGAFTFCVDFSATDYPLIEFDLIQFRNDNLAEPFEASSMMRVAWEGSEEGKQIIYGQPEGQLVPHKISLPPNFSGQLEIRFSNHTGRPMSVPDFLEYDVNLMDNLRFSNDPTVHQQELTEQPIQLFPNPVLDLLYIENGKNLRDLKILNTQGQVLYAESSFRGNSIDLSDLPNGYYWLSAKGKNQLRATLPFVKF